MPTASPIEYDSHLTSFSCGIKNIITPWYMVGVLFIIIPSYRVLSTGSKVVSIYTFAKVSNNNHAAQCKGFQVERNIEILLCRPTVWV